MFKLTDNDLLKYINEDLPYFDMTSHIQNIKNKKASLEIYTRDDIVVACSEESARMAELLNCEVIFNTPSGTKLEKGSTILKLRGDYNDIQQTLKVSQVLMEYSCKIATYTNKMIEAIKEVNEKCELLTTRKSLPFAKKMCIKSILCGGATPHRLGLSETVLFFSYHRSVYENNEEFYKEVKKLKHKIPEKKLVIESEEFEDSKRLMQLGADVVQLDKLPSSLVKQIVDYKNENFPNVSIIAAGGVNLEKVKEYASTGVNGIVTSAVYSTGMANLGCKFIIND